MSHRTSWLHRAFLAAALVFSPATLAPLLEATAEAAPANPFRVEVLPLKLGAGGSGKLQVMVVVPPEFHVFRDMMAVEILAPGGLTIGAPVYPPGEWVEDPASPGTQREQFGANVLIDLPVTAPEKAGIYTAQLRVRYQGCKKSLCYMPAQEDHAAQVEVSGGGGAAGSTSPAQKAPAPAPEFLISSVGGSAPTASPAPAVDHGSSLAAGPRSPVPSVDFSSLPQSAVAQRMDGDKPHPVKARLLMDQTALQPGQKVRLGVHLEQAPGWHTYWRSPGDIGLPTTIQWGLPGGMTTEPMAWPAPNRFQLQDIVSYGYDEQVLLFVEGQVPAGLSPGPAEISAEVSWLVCQSSCIPGSASLKLPVTVGPGGPSPQAPLFEHYANLHPIPMENMPGITVGSVISASAVRPEEKFKVAFQVSSADGPLPSVAEVGTWPLFAPIVEGSYMLNSSTYLPGPGGSAVIVLEGETYAADPLPTSDRVGGLLQVQVGDKVLRGEYTIPLPWAAAGAAVTAQSSPLFELKPSGAPVAPPVAAAPPVAEAQSLPLMLLLAFAGGMLLNIMPCVLPVVTLKLYGLVEQGGTTEAERRSAGLAYTAGIVASFLALALVVVLLRSSFDMQVGWGFQFQYPGYVVALATVVFVFGLSLLGVFEIPALGADAASRAAGGRDGAMGHFLNGVFATLLATPCSAPLLGTGMGFAFGLPAPGLVAFFGVAGLGLAAPFLLVAFIPGVMRFVPQPGAWMDTFKQLLGFSLMATTIWLADVLAAQVGSEGLVGFLAFLCVVGMGAWGFGRYGSVVETGQRQLLALGAAVGLAALGGWRFLKLDFADECAPAAASASSGPLDFSVQIPWLPFSEAAVQAQVGKPVFIDFTAEWCLTCKVNERTILETAEVRSAMAELGVTPLKADWTRRDEVITAWLQRYGKAGVPFYLVIPADPAQAPIPLPEVITSGLVVDALKKASGS